MSLVHDSIQFHNVEELEAVPGLGGLRLQRFPAEVRDSLGFKDHSRGRFFSHRAAGCELRFVTEGKFVRVTVSAVETNAEAIIWKGPFMHSRHPLKSGVMTSLFLEEPPMFGQVNAGMLRGRGFAGNVWRITFNQDACVLYHQVDAFGHALRPPEAGEIPARRWLAYGSSITFGGNAYFPANTYVQCAARKLGVDVLCKGLPGSALCEPQMANYIASQAEWHFATLELGVNLVELATPEEFRERVEAMLEKISSQNREKRIFVMGIFPNRGDYFYDRGNVAARQNPVFNEIVLKSIAKLDRPNLRYIDASEVLTDVSGLCTDLVHPSDEGHIAMGENLAALLQPYVSREPGY